MMLVLDMFVTIVAFIAGFIYGFVTTLWEMNPAYVVLCVIICVFVVLTQIRAKKKQK